MYDWFFYVTVNVDSVIVLSPKIKPALSKYSILHSLQDEASFTNIYLVYCVTKQFSDCKILV